MDKWTLMLSSRLTSCCMLSTSFTSIFTIGLVVKRWLMLLCWLFFCTMISKYNLLLYLWFYVQMLILHPRLGNSATQRLGKLLCDSWTFIRTTCTAATSIASDNVDSGTKQEMATKLLQQPRELIPMKKAIAPKVYDDSKLSDFTDSQSWLFINVSIKLILTY